MIAKGHHPGEDDFERYALGTATEEQSAVFEEHLLLCEPCRSRLDETDVFVKSTISAASTIRRKERESRVLRFPPRWAWAVAAGLALLGAVTVYRSAPGFAPVPAISVVLESARGPVSAAPAGRPLQLRADLSGLPAFEQYALEVVDARNNPVWKGTLKPSNPEIQFSRHRAGTYFVRVYSPQRELLREYGLELKN